MSRLMLSAFGATALLIGASAQSAAQKEHAAPHMEQKAVMHRSKADHRAAKAEMKDDKETAEMVARKKTAEKAEDRREKMTLRDAHEQSSHLLKGVKLSSAEREQVKVIDKRYEAQFKALKKDEHAADKSGPSSDAVYEQKIAALAVQERGEIRAVVPAAEQTRFEANANAMTAAKH